MHKYVTKLEISNFRWLKEITWTTHPLDNMNSVDSPKGKNRQQRDGREKQTLRERTQLFRNIRAEVEGGRENRPTWINELTNESVRNSENRFKRSNPVPNYPLFQREGPQKGEIQLNRQRSSPPTFPPASIKYGALCFLPRQHAGSGKLHHLSLVNPPALPPRVWGGACLEVGRRDPETPEPY